jgi:hypothetical protein
MGSRGNGDNAANTATTPVAEAGKRMDLHVPDDARADFTCTGPRIWRGGYNSGKTDSTNNLYLNTELGINRVAVRSTLTPGAITVTARSDSLKPTQLQLVSKSVIVTDGIATFMPPRMHPEPIPLGLKDPARAGRDRLNPLRQHRQYRRVHCKLHAFTSQQRCRVREEATVVGTTIRLGRCLHRTGVHLLGDRSQLLIRRLLFLQRLLQEIGNLFLPK